MQVRSTITREDLAEIIEIEGEGEYIYERQLEVTEHDGYVVVLLEKLRGVIKTLDNPGNFVGDRLKGRVELYILNAKIEFRSLKLRVESQAGAAFRLTMAFFRKTVTNIKEEMPCKLCKAACKVTLSVILASLGIPYLDLEEAQAGINLTGFKDEIGQFLDNPQAAAHGIVAELLEQTGLVGAIRIALEVLGWICDAEDRLYTFACSQAGCCP
ncbi:hypothetical protein [Ensifer sp. ENS11]|uniref:hypothetical protein n=1 Tax=Ensifer sp. ENS11 TaxID=2769291 RepID=UPI00177F8E8E|nr:hypothetical protein [Ensifer sp. ENS11]MBD9488741.1 hypothetical protein [Ensifer sp. ENS11]